MFLVCSNKLPPPAAGNNIVELHYTYFVSRTIATILKFNKSIGSAMCVCEKTDVFKIDPSSDAW